MNWPSQSARDRWTQSLCPFTEGRLSTQQMRDVFVRSGNNKNPLAAGIMTCLAVRPDDQALLDLASAMTLPGLIAREENPFIETAPSDSDFDQNHYLVLGRIPETGALWTLNDEGNLSHIFVLSITGGGKSQWAMMAAAEILEHESRRDSCTAPLHTRAQLTA